MSNNMKKELENKLIRNVMSQLNDLRKLSTDNNAYQRTMRMIRSYFNAGIDLGLVTEMDFDILVQLARLGAFESKVEKKKRLTLMNIAQKRREIFQLEESLRY